MKRSPAILRCAAAILALWSLSTAAALAFSLNDIQIWAGSGANQAAFVIDWSSPEVFNNTNVPAPITNKSLAWGYRFDGTATGADMLNAIQQADPRLKVITGFGGGFVFGFAYDLNDNGVVGVVNGDDPDNSYSLDPGDLYWGGLFGPGWELWHELNAAGGFSNIPDRGPDPYWTPDDPNSPWSGTHGQWQLSQTGIAGLNLKDGSWMGFSVARGGLEWGNDSAPGTIAYNFHKQAPGVPVAVVPEPATLCGLLGGLAMLRARISRRKR